MNLDIKATIDILGKFKNYADKTGISIWVVGSLGYRNALYDHSILKECDDIDCVFVYENISQLYEFEHISKEFIDFAEHKLMNNEVDMFSNKFYIEDIQVSADYVSIDYLIELRDEVIDGNDKYRKKLTDAIEKSQNIYCDVYGNRVVYNKHCDEFEKYRSYTLPIHLYNDGVFVPGVLLNKFLYNPQCLADHNCSISIVEQIYNAIEKYCRKYDTNASIFNTFYRKEKLCEEVRCLLGGKV